MSDNEHEALSGAESEDAVPMETSTTTSNDDDDTHHATPPSKTTCHVLPCNIDYHGMAPSHVYFRPAEVEPGICASTFRGRGLLAKCGNAQTAEGAMLLEVDHGKLKVKSEIDEVLEWQHEHNVDVLKYDDAQSRFHVAQAWGEVASALHDPLPLEDTQTATIQ